jgi:hypothetical protein
VPMFISRRAPRSISRDQDFDFSFVRKSGSVPGSVSTPTCTSPSSLKGGHFDYVSAWRNSQGAGVCGDLSRKRNSNRQACPGMQGESGSAGSAARQGSRGAGCRRSGARKFRAGGIRSRGLADARRKDCYVTCLKSESASFFPPNCTRPLPCAMPTTSWMPE